jgi:ribulose 1,5-bisphosphate synthetase/thiazole synthase
MVNPRVAEPLGLETEPSAADYDMVVVGAGPAEAPAQAHFAKNSITTAAGNKDMPL